MGTIKKGIIGGFAGKVGPVIGSSWKGIPYMKTRPDKVANPRTLGQMNHRGKLVRTIRFLSSLKVFLRAGYCELAIRMTEFNAAMSWNYHHAVTGSYPEFTIDYPKVLVSRGTLAGALNPQVKAEEGLIRFTWQNNADNMQVMDTDRVLLLAYHPARQKAVYLIDGNARDSGFQELPIPSHFIGEELHCYLAFRNMEKTSASNSQWLGSIVAV